MCATKINTSGHLDSYTNRLANAIANEELDLEKMHCQLDNLKDDFAWYKENLQQTARPFLGKAARREKLKITISNSASGNNHIIKIVDSKNKHYSFICDLSKVNPSLREEITRIMKIKTEISKMREQIVAKKNFINYLRTLSTDKPKSEEMSLQASPHEVSLTRKALPIHKRKKDLADLFNFKNRPGCHTIKSPVVGSRAHEFLAVQAAIKSEPILLKAEQAIYNPRFNYLIPLSKKDEADTIARELFLNYIAKYAIYGCSERNIVHWVYGGRLDVSNKTYIFDEETALNTWHTYVVVEARHGRCNEDYNKYAPPHVIAYHELMHAEETPLKAKRIIGQENGNELLTTIKSFILLDFIYKKIHKIAETDEVNYRKFIHITGTKIPLGKFINFYREEERRTGKLHLAIISPRSIQFLKGKI